MKQILIIFLSLFFAAPAFSQANLNKVWVTGCGLYNYQINFTTNNTTAQFWDTSGCYHNSNSNICDSAGNLLLASTSGTILDADNNIIENGDTLISPEYYGWLGGGNYNSNGSLILPMGDDIYFHLNPSVSDSVTLAEPDLYQAPSNELLYSIVDMSLNNGQGKVTQKRIPLLKDTLMSHSQMMACRHANGKDWWLTKQAAYGNKLYTFYLSKDSISGPLIQSFAQPYLFFDFFRGWSVFSNKGDKYATVSLGSDTMFLADFDRCNGTFSNPQYKRIPTASTHHPVDSSYQDPEITGIAFSPNDSLIYIGRRANIFQYEQYNPDSATAWVRVAGIDTTYPAFFDRYYFGIAKGYDDRLYIGRQTGTSLNWSVINNPNIKGLGCNFCPNCLQFPSPPIPVSLFTPPNMPNYALGAKNPPCEPSSITTTVTQKTFTIHPNPATTTLTLEASSAGILTLTDMLGRTLLTATIQRGKQTIDISPLPSGVYSYQFTPANVALSPSKRTGKLLINH